MTENNSPAGMTIMRTDPANAGGDAMTVKEEHALSLWRRLALPGRVRLLIFGWTLVYALYRAYYALGGMVGTFGIPISWGQWRFINAVAAGILLIVAILPIATTPLSDQRAVRTVLLVLCWVAAVGCVMHALVDGTQRVLSLTGVLHIVLPSSFWASYSQRSSDLQDLLWNEPWFLIEGLLWGLLGWTGCSPGSARRRYLFTALAAIAMLTTVGILSATGVIGTFIVG